MTQSSRALSFGLLLLALAGLAEPACGRTQAPPPLTAAPDEPSDGGLPVPPPSAKKSIIVPADTGLGAGPSGTSSYTGTNGTAVGPTLGQSPSN